MRLRFHPLDIYSLRLATVDLKHKAHASGQSSPQNVETAHVRTSPRVAVKHDWETARGV